jgi:hypothetical protein
MRKWRCMCWYLITANATSISYLGGICFIMLFRSVIESVTATLCNILTSNNLPADCVIEERDVPVKVWLVAEIFSRAIFYFRFETSTRGRIAAR